MSNKNPDLMPSPLGIFAPMTTHDKYGYAGVEGNNPHIIFLDSTQPLFVPISAYITKLLEKGTYKLEENETLENVDIIADGSGISFNVFTSLGRNFYDHTENSIEIENVDIVKDLLQISNQSEMWGRMLGLGLTDFHLA